MLAEADLPDDPEVLRAMIVAANARTAKLTAEFERISAEAERNAIAKAEADAEIARLSSIIAAFARHRFGPRSEKLDDDQFELVMEDLSIAIAKVEAKLDSISTPAKRAEKQRCTNRGSLPTHLERIEQVIDIDSKLCACCGGALHAIGEDVAERLDVVPASFRVLVTRRPRYACRACEGEVVQAPAPSRRSKVGCRPMHWSPRCWSRSTPIICRSIGRRRSTPARASTWTVRRWPTG